MSTLYFGMNLPGTMMKSAKTLGLMAGGAAGGPAGVAAGAAAGAGLSTAATGLKSMAEMATPSAGGGGAGGATPRSASE